MTCCHIWLSVRCSNYLGLMLHQIFKPMILVYKLRIVEIDLERKNLGTCVGIEPTTISLAWGGIILCIIRKYPFVEIYCARLCNCIFLSVSVQISPLYPVSVWKAEPIGVNIDKPRDGTGCTTCSPAGSSPYVVCCGLRLFAHLPQSVCHVCMIVEVVLIFF